MTWFWKLELIHSPLQTVVVVAALVLATVLVAAGRRHRGRGRPRAWWWLVAGAAGAVVLSVIVVVLQERNLFDGDLPEGTAPWVVAAGALMGLGALGLWLRPWWGKIAAVLLIVASALGLGLQVNRLYGITDTPGAIFGVNTLPVARLPHTSSMDGKTEITLTNWVPPKNMPHHGRTGVLLGKEAIPTSRPYSPRPASIYLPPAALVKHPPRLPVVVAMMGQPGSPDPTVVAAQANAYAARHQGLAPIIVVVDQLAGSGENDPICMDSQRFGAVSTYVNVDVVRYIKEHLNVLPDPKDWAIGGYSNGGSCAWQWGTQYPEIWGSILDVSGNLFPGSQHQADVIANLWGGDKAAYTAWLPTGQIAKHAGGYEGHLASFTYGSDDAKYGPAARTNAAAARAAGFTVKLHSIAGGAHTGLSTKAGYGLVIEDFGAHTGLDRAG